MFFDEPLEFFFLHGAALPLEGFSQGGGQEKFFTHS